MWYNSIKHTRNGPEYCTHFPWWRSPEITVTIWSPSELKTANPAPPVRSAARVREKDRSFRDTSTLHLATLQMSSKPRVIFCFTSCTLIKWQMCDSLGKLPTNVSKHATSILLLCTKWKSDVTCRRKKKII